MFIWKGTSKIKTVVRKINRYNTPSVWSHHYCSPTGARATALWKWRKTLTWRRKQFIELVCSYICGRRHLSRWPNVHDISHKLSGTSCTTVQANSSDEKEHMVSKLAHTVSQKSWNLIVQGVVFKVELNWIPIVDASLDTCKGSPLEIS